VSGSRNPGSRLATVSSMLKGPWSKAFMASYLAQIWQGCGSELHTLRAPQIKPAAGKLTGKSPQPHMQGSGTGKVRLSRRESIFGLPGSGKR
jgi:hypothetical protein